MNLTVPIAQIPRPSSTELDHCLVGLVCDLFLTDIRPYTTATRPLTTSSRPDYPDPTRPLHDLYWTNSDNSTSSRSLLDLEYRGHVRTIVIQKAQRFWSHSDSVDLTRCRKKPWNIQDAQEGAGSSSSCLGWLPFLSFF